MSKDKYMVVTRCFTYNQAPYIEETLHGFMIQETTFPTAYLIVDDASTDGEQNLLTKWADEHLLSKNAEQNWEEMPYGKLLIAPQKENPQSLFVLLLLNENHYQHGKDHLKLTYISEWNSNAKYLAICEGDDYWIDPHKLQTQVDYLEKRPYICFSCTRCKELNQKNGELRLLPNYYFDNETNNEKELFEFSRTDAFSHTWFTKTLTFLYRKDCVDAAFPLQFRYYRDVHMVYMLLSKGNGVCHSIVSGVYRLNESSTFGGKSNLEKVRQNYLVYEELYRYTGDKLMKQTAASCYVELYKNNYMSYGKPHNAFQYYVIFWFSPVLSIKRRVKKFLQYLHRQHL